MDNAPCLGDVSALEDIEPEFSSEHAESARKHTRVQSPFARSNLVLKQLDAIQVTETSNLAEDPHGTCFLRTLIQSVSKTSTLDSHGQLRPLGMPLLSVGTAPATSCRSKILKSLRKKMKFQTSPFFTSPVLHGHCAQRREYEC